MKLTARMPSVVSSSTSSSQGKTWYGNQDPGKSVVVDDRSGKLERPSPPGYSKSDYGRSWSSHKWKSEATAHDRWEKPDETGNKFVFLETLLDGGVQSVRYGEIIHDGSGQPDSVNYQEEAESEIFVMWSDAAEFGDGLPALELWDKIVSVLGNVSRVSDRSGQLDNVHKRPKSQGRIDVMENKFPQMSNLRVKNVYVFEDNEVVIKNDH